MTEDEMVGWHHRLNEHGFGWTPGVAQTHIHQVGDAVQPSYPLSSPFSTAFNRSQHQGFFQ